MADLITGMMDMLEKRGKKLAKDGGTFTQLYNYWIKQLTEYAFSRLTYKKMDTIGIPAREVEMVSIYNGLGFAVRYNGTAPGTEKMRGNPVLFAAEWAGEPTLYYDTFESVSVESPMYSDVLPADSGVILRNNKLERATYPKIHEYAMLLAHTESTFLNTMINLRDIGGKPVAGNKSQMTALENYRNDLCNGRVMPIHDPAFAGVKFLDTKTGALINAKDLYEIRMNLLQDFFAEIGIRTVSKKKGNLIAEEVHGDDAMLEHILHEHLECHKEFIEGCNAKFGGDAEVDIADYLRYDDVEEVLKIGQDND